MTPREIVRSYYKADLANEKDVLERFLHPDCQLNWHSSKGFNILNRDAINVLYQDIQKSYSTFRTRISHLLEDRDHVTARYTIYVTPMETGEEIAMAHFITIWQVKDGKLYRGYEMSQGADVSKESLDSFK